MIEQTEMEMTGGARILLDEVKAGLANIYGSRLKGVYLYGSFARGEHDPESDFDVLVILDDFERYGSEVDRTSGLASALSLDHDLSISMVFLRPRDWTQGETPFLTNVRREAVQA
ncbi:MAG: nucleotidyltransferase domain-containing protein [Pseudomonadota bacterium]